MSQRTSASTVETVLCYTSALEETRVDFSQLKAEIKSEIDKRQTVLAVLNGGRPNGKKRTTSAAGRRRFSRLVSAATATECLDFLKEGRT
jgi:predicted NAD/FAD-binding protein